MDEKTGRTLHGVRGLKSLSYSSLYSVFQGRTLHGVRGLKYLLHRPFKYEIQSHSSWSAWIEICLSRLIISTSVGRTLHGVRGLK